MDITLLRTFLEVARTRHFGRAAANLCVTQSAVSARIKLIEGALGVPLFTRRRNDIQLTPAGHGLVRYAETIVRSWTRARQELARDGRFGRSLAVGCQLDLWPIRVREWVATLRRARPDLAVQLEILPADTLWQRLASDLLDLALLFDPPGGPAGASQAGGDLELKPLPGIELVMVADRPGLTAAEAVAQGYILVDWGSAFMVAHSERFPELPPVSLRVFQGPMALDLLLDLGGAAYLPRPLAADALAEGRLFPVADAPPLARQSFAAYRPGRADGGALRDALAALMETAPAVPAQLREGATPAPCPEPESDPAAEAR